MVRPALDGPGIRLRAAELLALREDIPARSRHRPATRRPGALPARPAGAGMDLREIRAFAEGDDARRIDPAATARTGAPHIRSFHEDRDDTLLLIADFRPSMLWGTGTALRSVHAARLLAKRGWQAAARGASLAAISVDATGLALVPSGAGAMQMSRISQMLAGRHDQALRDQALHDRAQAVQGEAPTLAEALIRATRLAPPGGEVLVATGPDGIEAVDEPALARLARRRRVRVALALDPVDRAPPSRALPIHAGPLSRFARLRPLDPALLSQRLRVLNVGLEMLADDAG
ncbi:DUF58 domain-containing protein [Ancylobacter oerskovii]|uniref:DUF58 domain-containing protein n=1 Tax=Ancylobacter oerskovii TaxID=459519 RepID=A0ABW4YW75_9HYPH|nr:DUF58 domain-containing protein [Ancylobacter oerskovii]MBS7544127.1 DUF58 domain-containing protein [Ancylobacter oerskovii]